MPRPGMRPRAAGKRRAFGSDQHQTGALSVVDVVRAIRHEILPANDLQIFGLNPDAVDGSSTDSNTRRCFGASTVMGGR